MDATIIKQLLEAKRSAEAGLTKINGALTQLGYGSPKQPKRRLSAAGRKAIAKAQRARWAKAKKQQK